MQLLSPQKLFALPPEQDQSEDGGGVAWRPCSSKRAALHLPTRGTQCGFPCSTIATPAQRRSPGPEAELTPATQCWKASSQIILACFPDGVHEIGTPGSGQTGLSDCTQSTSVSTSGTYLAPSAPGLQRGQRPHCMDGNGKELALQQNHARQSPSGPGTFPPAEGPCRALGGAATSSVILEQ